jgi:hypothetical protein
LRSRKTRNKIAPRSRNYELRLRSRLRILTIRLKEIIQKKWMNLQHCLQPYFFFAHLRRVVLFQQIEKMLRKVLHKVDYHCLFCKKHRTWSFQKTVWKYHSSELSPNSERESIMPCALRPCSPVLKPVYISPISLLTKSGFHASNRR